MSDVGFAYPIVPNPATVNSTIIEAINEALAELSGAKGKAFLTQHPDVVNRIPQWNPEYYRRKYHIRTKPASVTIGELRKSGRFEIQYAGTTRQGIAAVWGPPTGAPYAQYVAEMGLTGTGHPSTPGTTLKWTTSQALQSRIREFVYQQIRDKLIEKLGRHAGLVSIQRPTGA